MGKYDELKASLRAMYSHRGDGIPTQWVNPDGPEAATAITTLEAEVAAMKARGDRLAEFAVHRADCASRRIHFTAVTPDCTCGLPQALTEWRDQ